MMPAAPPLFSITTEMFHMVESFCPTTRASASVPPPGGKPTTMRTGPDGRVCALSMGDATMAAVAAVALIKVLRCMVSLPDG